MARWMTSLASSLVALGLVGATTFAGCGGTEDGSKFKDGNGDGNGNGDDDQFVDPNGDGGPNGNGGPCVGLQCQQVSCAGGGTTSLSGKVFDPTGTVPLYNAVVYVPNEAVAAFEGGVTCDQCGTVPSGKPIATALTNAKGEFVLQNVPVGVEIPLVVQLGRWRRQVKVPAVKQCTDTPLAADATRLPRNKSEGDIPHIAITTGNADSLECFLRKLGIDDSEFTNPDGNGRIHLFQGKREERDRNGNVSRKDGSALNAQTPAGAALWNDLNRLKQYDMVILSCEGAENDATKSNQAKDNLRKYLDAGGRVFASHFHYDFFKKPSGNPLAATANWTSGSSNAGDRDMNVDTGFAKGQAFSEWLVEAKASTTAGIVPATDLRRSLTTVPASGAPADTSRNWLSYNGDTKFYSFNTPLNVGADKQCGRGVYTDIHVSSGPGLDQSGGTFPNNCVSPKPSLSPQEKALLFLLMDLASCIQDDNAPPAPPPVVK